MFKRLISSFLVVAILMFSCMPAQAMHHARRAWPYISLGIRGAAAIGATFVIAGEALSASGEIDSYPFASPDVTAFVHNALIKHGVDYQKVGDIQVKKGIEFMGHRLFDRKDIIVPHREIEDLLDNRALNDVEQKSKRFEGICVHEYGHIVHEDIHVNSAILLSGVAWLLRGSPFFIIPKVVTTVLLCRMKQKYDEYRADQLAIELCSASHLKELANDNYERHAHLMPVLESRGISPSRFNDDIWYREFKQMVVLREIHPSFLTRAQYFEAAAKRKAIEEQEQKKLT